METSKGTFAVFFGNRGFFPASLQAGARKEMVSALRKLGHKAITLDAKATRHGAVETPAEGRRYAEFLSANRGKFDGVILCLPNFGDETGAVAALKDAGVPILIQAYPDELGRMAPKFRRDAFCGKFSVMDVFCQYGVKFTALKPHTVHPNSDAFAKNMDYFARLCRVVAGMRDMTVVAVGARTTAFKTVRIDELTLQRHGITVETLDLSDVFARMKALKSTDKALKSKLARLKSYTTWKGVPASAVNTIARLGVVLDQITEEYGPDALAIRCWIEMQQQLGISPCVLLSEMNDRGVVAACEVDVGSAVSMRGLQLASGNVATCLDWNNNYGEEKGKVTDHEIVLNVIGRGRSYGCNVGRIAPTPFTFGNAITEAGKVRFYLGQGRFTDDEIPEDFFGCAGVAQIDRLQDALQTIGYLGHRHHVAATAGHVAEPLIEAFEKYLGYDVTRV